MNRYVVVNQLYLASAYNCETRTAIGTLLEELDLIVCSGPSNPRNFLPSL